MEQVRRNGYPVAGFSLGECACAPAVGAGDPGASAVHLHEWKVAAITSAVGVATGWVMEELARHFRRRKKRR